MAIINSACWRCSGFQLNSSAAGRSPSELAAGAEPEKSGAKFAAAAAGAAAATAVSSIAPGCRSFVHCSVAAGCS